MEAKRKTLPDGYKKKTAVLGVNVRCKFCPGSQLEQKMKVKVS